MGWGEGISGDFIWAVRSGMVTLVAFMGDDEGEGPILRNLRGTCREGGKRVSGAGRARSGNGWRPCDQFRPWSKMTGASEGCISQDHLLLAVPGLDVWFRKQPVALSRAILYWFKKTLEVTNK